MIHLHRGLCLLLTREPGTDDEKWLDQLADSGGELQMVLIEGVELVGSVLCPHCCEPKGEVALGESALLSRCRKCGQQFLALAFPAQTEARSWFTFPWPS